MKKINAEPEQRVLDKLDEPLYIVYSKDISECCDM
jgi:hypothetical protein